jgi:hypothetical protein
MKRKCYLGSVALLLVMWTLAGCGGGSGGGGDDESPATGTTATGYFKDNNVSGLTYTSGDQSGVTDARGRFTYEVGQPVTFSIGGVTVGSATGKTVVTPVDLVSGGSSDTTAVQNIVRFLIMLDEDGDSSNGISIATSVQEAAADWSQVNFSTSDLESEVSSIITDATDADGGSHSLPTATTAQSHLEETMRCSYAGAYQGTYTGDDRGVFGIMVDAQTGEASGAGYSIPWDEVFYLTGSTPLSYDQNLDFISGNVSTGATFQGSFSASGAVSGTWSDPYEGDSGTFQGSRIGGALNAVYRFTGTYSGDDNGLFAFDVDAQNNITGVAYSVLDDDLDNLTGSLSGTSLSITTDDGTTVSGTLNTTTGSLYGTWQSTGGDSGTFTGAGCRLN